MRPQPDAGIATLAAAQHGAITRSQALAAGLTGRQIELRLAAGRWERIGRGAYRIGGSSPSCQQVTSAAVALRPGSRASYGSAAVLADLSAATPHRPHLTVDTGMSGRHPFATVHRCDLEPSEVTRLQGVPATTVPRTLVDLASVLGRRRLQPLVDEALHRSRATPRGIEVIAARQEATRTHAGIQQLLEMLEPWRGGVVPGSPAEARLFRQVVEWGLPAPEKQITVRDEHGQAIARIDAGWSPRRIGLEYDSDRWHQPNRWGNDELRHQRLTNLGWTILHVGRADLHAGETALRDRLLAIWARAPATDRPTNRSAG